MSANSIISSKELGLHKYLEEIKALPLLNEGEELALAIRWHDTGDVDAAHRLVLSHLRLVAKIAMQFKSYGLPLLDLISEGNIGLMTAVKKFNPHLGFKLATYAMWWIKAHIQDYILKSWSIVKMGTSAAHKKLFFNLRKIQNRIYHANSGQLPADINEIIAKELDVPLDNVNEISARLGANECLLNQQNYNDTSEMIDSIPENKDNQEIALIKKSEDAYKRRKLKSAFTILNERERQIICARRLQEKPIKLEQLSKTFGVSSERIRQIEERAMQKLIKAVGE